MTCKELLEFLADYLDGELPADAKQVFEKHLSVCSPCRNYLKSYEATIRLAKTAKVDDRAEAAPLPEALVEAIKQSAHRHTV